MSCIVWCTCLTYRAHAFVCVDVPVLDVLLWPKTSPCISSQLGGSSVWVESIGFHWFILLSASYSSGMVVVLVSGSALVRAVEGCWSSYL